MKKNLKTEKKTILKVMLLWILIYYEFYKYQSFLLNSLFLFYCRHYRRTVSVVLNIIITHLEIALNLTAGIGVHVSTTAIIHPLRPKHQHASYY